MLNYYISVIYRMSAYPPPLQDLPIYNSVEFIEENFPLTIQDAKSFFLEYPTAQGAETLQNIVVNGTSAFNSDMTINGDLEIHTPGTGITFPDGTIQTTASTGNTETHTSDTPTYDAVNNWTIYLFQTYPTTFDKFNWDCSPPYTAQTTRQLTNLGSSPPLAVGEIIFQPFSYFMMNGVGVKQPYQATSSNMITYCAGFQQNYSITATGIGVNLNTTTIVSGTPNGLPQFFSNDLTENNGTCPPTANPITGYISIGVEGNFSNNGVATMNFYEVS